MTVWRRARPAGAVGVQNGARVLVGDPGRAFLRTAGFEPLATYEIPVTIALEGTTSKQATGYEISG